MSENTITGVPSFVLFPAKNYKFKLSNENYTMTIPRRGSYHDLDPDFFPEESGSFNIMDDEKSILFTPAIVKVLFATKKYPALKFNQFFVPAIIKFDADEVTLIGRVAEMLIQFDESTEDEGDLDAMP